VARSAEERFEALGAFLGESGPDRCIVLVGCGEQAELYARMLEWGVDLAALAATGLVVPQPHGVDPAVALDLLPRRCRRPVRVAVWGDPERLVHTETSLATLAARLPAEILCVHRALALAPGDREVLGRLHGGLVRLPSVYDDGLLRVTEAPDGVVRLAGEADRSNTAVLADVLGGLLAAGRRTLDLRRLRFADRRTVRLLLGLAAGGVAALCAPTPPVGRLLALASPGSGALAPAGPGP
jgi:hypothetical protein